MASRMLQEALEAPQAVEALLEQLPQALAPLVASLRREAPSGVVTMARGSSDHAANFFAYLVMARLGRLVTSLPMSLITLYGSRLQSRGLVTIAFSQSGQSPDLVEPTRLMRAQGARSVAFVNDVASPLAHAAEFVVALHAGRERSVAATKSTITQLVAGAALAAAWQQDRALLDALQTLPDTLTQAAQLRWDAALAPLVAVDRLYVIGRGLGLAVALEAALKFKETCGIQAEAFSSAEVQHGPMALVDRGFAVLVLAPRGPAQAGLLNLAETLCACGAQVFLAMPAHGPDVPGLDRAHRLALGCAAHEDLDPIAMAQTFYPMVEELARARGRDPDQPPHLSKVTRTH